MHRNKNILALALAALLCLCSPATTAQDFSEITDEFVSWVENKLNNRPRKRLGYLTPNEKFNSILTKLTNKNSIAFKS